VDPFVSSHELDENNNPQMGAAVLLRKAPDAHDQDGQEAVVAVLPSVRFARSSLRRRVIC
jgi:hypothetical protein